MDFTAAILDSRLGLNIAYPLKLGIPPKALERVAPDLARTPDQGLFFVGYAGPISGRPLTSDNLTQTGDEVRNIAYRFSTCRLA